MPPDTARTRRNPFRTLLVVLASVFVVGFIFRLTEAGPLTPSTLPAATLHTLEDIFAPLASSGYDSSSVVPSKSGNALQITKCIIQRMQGGAPCP
jgi:hypothetical protein